MELKESDFLIDYGDWYIAECDVPFGSGILKIGGVGKFEELEEFGGKKWIYVRVLLALRKRREYRDGTIEEIRPTSYGMRIGEDWVPFNRRNHLDASELAKYMSKIAAFSSAAEWRIVLDTQFKLIEFKSKKQASGESKRIPLNWFGDTDGWFIEPFPKVVPVERQPKLIEFLSPKLWLEHGIIRQQMPLTWRKSVQTFIVGFISEYVNKEIWKEEGQERGRDGVMGENRRSEREVAEKMAKKIAEEITDKMSEGELKNFGQTCFFDPDALHDQMFWVNIFRRMWDIPYLNSTYNLYEEHEDPGLPFGLRLGRDVWQWSNIARGKDSLLFEAMGRYLDRLPTIVKRYDIKSINDLLKVKILRLRNDVEALLHREENKYATDELIDEFMVRCYDALVDELEAKGITRRCKVCSLPIVLTRKDKEYCYYGPPKPLVERSPYNCRKQAADKRYQKGQKKKRQESTSRSE